MSLREIVGDTETTGLGVPAGHRLCEVGLVEVIDRRPTGRAFHAYVNPERDMPPDAFRIHGLSDAFLARMPLFEEIADDMLAFIGDAPVVAHNASFEREFLNAELVIAGRPPIAEDRFVDTVRLSRKRTPGKGIKHTLDAVLTRFKIDASRRTLHGALLDAQLLAEVYPQLLADPQAEMDLLTDLAEPGADDLLLTIAARTPRPPRVFGDEEIAAHKALMSSITSPIWDEYRALS
ncbi:DNA polymerase III subunit epsilon [Methylobacterium ajmalii]|uniref:DNA polymerase III subunit epsilon n=1 Tax=Methylobacterium ajmalii TaxID=2738439 RepID=A0ABV0A347_9HYPH